MFATKTEQHGGGFHGTAKTLGVMAAAVRGEISPDYCGYRAEGIRHAALSILRGIPGHRHLDELTALLSFVRDRVTYRLDPVDTERVQDACVTLQLQSGDCDDKTVLLATLLASIGHLPRFVAQHNGQEFNHVYCEALLNGQWMALDPTADGQGGMALAGVNWRNPAQSEWIFNIFL